MFSNCIFVIVIVVNTFAIFTFVTAISLVLPIVSNFVPVSYERNVEEHVSSESLVETDSIMPGRGGVVVATSVVLVLLESMSLFVAVENAPVKPHELVNGSLGKLGEKMLLDLLFDDDAATLEAALEEAVESAEVPITSRVLSASFFSLGKLGLIVVTAVATAAARLVVAAAASLVAAVTYEALSRAWSTNF